ncbi:MAG: mannose-1-phosphate guanylyltransferase/mannose-6-phosphate isomerase [Desulfobacca sp.]|uniref:mannose-1-phosphate guanylyltransferase/mannose-6-phosphate isomerase n=1 Tax=Desulfobacca sp. TaxID=2067990 RepID=UPI00404B4D1D
MTEVREIPIFGVILAGGSGTRFWPLSRAQYPKQVLRLLGSDSLLQATIHRLLPLIPLERLAIVTNAAQEDVVRLELLAKGWQALHLWFEPQSRNTAPAIGLAAALLQEQWPQGVMAVFPADHYIRDQENLLTALKIGAELAEQGYLVTFGIPPTAPETGFGYLQAGPPLEEHHGAYRCARFAEKPSAVQAQKFLAEGNYYWNSGIFMFRRDVIWEALGQHLPAVQVRLREALQQGAAVDWPAVYQDLPSISIDYGVMEKAANVAIVPVNMGWSDVGTWGALYDLFPADFQGNVILGNACDLDSRGCLIFSQERLVATLGLEGTIVVDTPDATLVCPRHRSQDVKDLVAKLQDRNPVELIHHTTVFRPWGSYTVINEGPGYKVKKIVVHPGKRLSLQLHHQRAEHWVVVQGVALVTIGSAMREVHPNESVYVPVETPHRLENPGTQPLAMIEVQTGAYLEEDDIVRLDDDFWRQPKGKEAI